MTSDIRMMTYVVTAPQRDIIADMRKWLDRIVFKNKTITPEGMPVEDCCARTDIACKIVTESQPGLEFLLADLVQLGVAECDEKGMPEMDGIELARRATELDPDLKVMFITGFAAVALNPDSKAPKDAKVLSKPFHLRDLVDEVNKMLAA